MQTLKNEVYTNFWQDITIQKFHKYTYKKDQNTYELFKNPANEKWEVWQVNSKKYIGCWKHKTDAKNYLDKHYLLVTT